MKNYLQVNRALAAKKTFNLIEMRMRVDADGTGNN